VATCTKGLGSIQLKDEQPFHRARHEDLRFPETRNRYIRQRASMLLLRRGDAARLGNDALNRLLRTLPWSTERLIIGLIRWIQRLGEDGYLCLDDVVVEKAFAKRLACVGGRTPLPSGVVSLASILCSCSGAMSSGGSPWASGCGTPRAMGMNLNKTKLDSRPEAA